jgi:hypothetical protein
MFFVPFYFSIAIFLTSNIQIFNVNNFKLEHFHKFDNVIPSFPCLLLLK